MKRWLLLIAFVSIVAGPSAMSGQTPESEYTIRPGDSLSELANRVYGDSRAWSAIMLGTNGRIATHGNLEFIMDPNWIQPRQHVWIPNLEEKDALVERFDKYVRAVQDMSRPQPWEVASDLVTISRDSTTVTMVSWVRNDQSASVDTSKRATGDIWVTRVPYLQEFCRRLESATEEDLTLRLEQRLGLPPKSNKTDFVLLSVASSDLFRPCSDPSVYESNCRLGMPEDNDSKFRDWFLSQYYGSYARAQPTRFPWTSLGYTYDWGSPESEVGESEFIIPRGASIRVQARISTTDYCK